MKNSDGKKYKLSGEHKEFIINKLALHCGQAEIVEAIKEAYNIDISPQGVDHYKKNYERDWRARREYINKHIAEIEPFADKSLRVQQRGELIRDLVKHLWFEDVKMKGNTVIYDVDGRAERFKLKGNHDVINKLLDSIHKEIEPFKIAHTNSTGENPIEINVKIVE